VRALAARLLGLLLLLGSLLRLVLMGLLRRPRLAGWRWLLRRGGR
jgi:hypothetical protein